MLSGSFFGHNASKGEIYTTLIVSLIIGAGGTFLYCRDMVIGSQKLVAEGRITIDSGFWLVLASLVISLRAGVYVFKERANKRLRIVHLLYLRYLFPFLCSSPSIINFYNIRNLLTRKAQKFWAFILSINFFTYKCQV